MKSYLCSEEEKEVVQPRLPEDTESRQGLLFVIKAKDLNEAQESAAIYGAKVIRALSKKEQESEGEDGSYDIKL